MILYIIFSSTLLKLSVPNPQKYKQTHSYDHGILVMYLWHFQFHIIYYPKNYLTNFNFGTMIVKTNIIAFKGKGKGIKWNKKMGIDMAYKSLKHIPRSHIWRKYFFLHLFKFQILIKYCLIAPKFLIFLSSNLKC